MSWSSGDVIHGERTQPRRALLLRLSSDHVRRFFRVTAGALEYFIVMLTWMSKLGPQQRKVWMIGGSVVLLGTGFKVKFEEIIKDCNIRTFHRINSHSSVPFSSLMFVVLLLPNVERSGSRWNGKESHGG